MRFSMDINEEQQAVRHFEFIKNYRSGKFIDNSSEDKQEKEQQVDQQ